MNNGTSTPSPRRPPTTFQPFNLSTSNRSPRAPSGVHKIPTSGYLSPRTSTTPRASKRRQQGSTPIKKIDFSPPKETKVITPTTEIRRKDKALSRSPKKKTRAKAVPPAAVTPPSRFQHITPPALNLKKVFREANYHEDYPSPASTIDKEEDNRDVSACSPCQEGERDSQYDVSSPYKLQTSIIIEPTPLRQAKALEEELLGHMHELESLTYKLMPFEQEQIDIQRRREDKKRQEEEIAMLEQSLQANKHQLKHQEENAMERILQLEERIQKLVKEAEQREGRSAEEIRALKNNVHGLTIAIQEQNVGKVTFGVFDSNHSAMHYTVFWNMIYWFLIRFPMLIVKTTLTWLIGLSLLGVVYSYLSPPEMLPSVVPHLDNVPRIF